MLRILFLLIVSVSAKAQTFYKTPSGQKYHSANCRMVKNTSEQINLVQAQKLGLEACKICNPQSVMPLSSSTNKAQGQGKTVQCAGYTKTGNQCKHMTKIANGYCFQHQPT